MTVYFNDSIPGNIQFIIEQKKNKKNFFSKMDFVVPSKLIFHVAIINDSMPDYTFIL